MSKYIWILAGIGAGLFMTLAVATVDFDPDNQRYLELQERADRQRVLYAICVTMHEGAQRSECLRDLTRQQ